MAIPDTRADQEAGTRGRAPDPANPHYAKRWWILVILGIAQLMVVLDSTSTCPNTIEAGQ